MAIMCIHEAPASYDDTSRSLFQNYQPWIQRKVPYTMDGTFGVSGSTDYGLNSAVSVIMALYV
jgi:hypothetical protein